MKNPIQPLAKDAKGVLRFKANAVVRHLLDWAQQRGMGLNELACLNFGDDDRQQFAQLIGYSLSGYGELQSYVDDSAYSTAANMAEGKDERDAHIAALEEKLQEVVAAERERIALAWDGTECDVFCNGLVDVGASIRAGRLVDRNET